jgi:hypothetical protein
MEEAGVDELMVVDQYVKRYEDYSIDNLRGLKLFATIVARAPNSFGPILSCLYMSYAPHLEVFSQFTRERFILLKEELRNRVPLEIKKFYYDFRLHGGCSSFSVQLWL